MRSQTRRLLSDKNENVFNFSFFSLHMQLIFAAVVPIANPWANRSITTWREVLNKFSIAIRRFGWQLNNCAELHPARNWFLSPSRPSWLSLFCDSNCRKRKKAAQRPKKQPKTAGWLNLRARTLRLLWLARFQHFPFIYSFYEILLFFPHDICCRWGCRVVALTRGKNSTDCESRLSLLWSLSVSCVCPTNLLKQSNNISCMFEVRNNLRFIGSWFDYWTLWRCMRKWIVRVDKFFSLSSFFLMNYEI